MGSSLTATVIAASLIVLVAILGARYEYLKRSYYFGVNIWSTWLPVLATAIYMSLLAVNLLSEQGQLPAALDLGKFFTTLELTVLFVVGPLFMTKIGFLIAFATLSFTIERFVSSGITASSSGCLYLFTSAVTFVALLGDKMPWLSKRFSNGTAQKIRDILVVGMGIASLGLMTAAFTKIPSFQKWVMQVMSIDIPKVVILFLLIGIFIGWLSVVLGFTRNVTLPLMSLPTLFVLAFVTGWPSYLLIIPFSVCLALALSTADRRNTGRQRSTGPGITTFVTR